MRVLRALAGMEPRWTLTGGGALCGYHLGHRDTRDLDLFFHGRDVLGHLPAEVSLRLRRAGLTVENLETAEAFQRLRVSDGTETVPVDLVAEPVPAIEPPEELEPGVLGDTRHEILVNKLNALYSRWAVRDLIDVRALLEAGGDLALALRDAPRKDGGFSPQSLAWVLDTLPRVNLSPELDAFRAWLVARLLEDDG
jgi:hypothetical protein